MTTTKTYTPHPFRAPIGEVLCDECGTSRHHSRHNERGRLEAQIRATIRDVRILSDDPESVANVLADQVEELLRLGTPVRPVSG